MGVLSEGTVLVQLCYGLRCVEIFHIRYFTIMSLNLKAFSFFLLRFFLKAKQINSDERQDQLCDWIMNAYVMVIIKNS